MAGRFDYVRYDEEHAEIQSQFRFRFEATEMAIETLPDGRAKSLAMTKLEECYMWIGKAIRDDQIAKGGDSEDQPHRG